MRLIIFLIAITSWACQRDHHRHTGESYEAEIVPDDLTSAMIQKVQDSYQSINFDSVNYAFNSKKAEALQNRLDSMTPGSEMNVVLYDFADELLRSGRVTEAIVIFEDFHDFFQAREFPNKSETISEIKRKLGIAYLRKAEIDNCVQHHNEESCILPISKKAQYTIKDPTLTAIKHFEDFLEAFPMDYEIQYLLNIACMTIGQYPGDIPEQFLIPQSYFDQQEFQRFKDVAPEIGVARTSLSGGVCFDDFNNDLFPDLIVSSWGQNDQLVYYQNDTRGSYKDLTSKTGLVGVTGGLNVKQADYNNDGHLDFFIMRGAWLDEYGRIPNSLIRNNGDGTFTDVTQSAGVFSERPTQSSIWADFNLDGWLDLFVANESLLNDDFYCELFLNNQDGTFAEVGQSAGFNRLGYFKGATAGDVNGDRYPDLYLSNYYGANLLYINAGNPDSLSFTVSTTADVGQPEESFSTWMFDYNNDGHEDIFVSSYSSGKITPVNMLMANMRDEFTQRRPVLYQNQGDGTFNNVSYMANLKSPETTMGCNYGDLNNDGFLDFYLATGDPSYVSIVPNKMYLNVEGTRFEDITFSGGFGHIQKGHAVGFADRDLDGDQDIYAVMGGAYEGDFFQNILFNNPGNSSNWIYILLRGTKSNRSAIGAKIELAVSAPKSRKIYRTISSGASFGGNSLMAEIGLGESTVVDEIKIHWPNQDTDISSVINVQPNQIIVIEEGQEGYLKQPL